LESSCKQDFLCTVEVTGSIVFAAPAGERGDAADDDELLRDLEALMDQEPEVDQLELHMAKLSVSEEKDEIGLLEDLPPVPTGALATPPALAATDRTKKEATSLLAATDRTKKQATSLLAT
jgi:hypothetical protein